MSVRVDGVYTKPARTKVRTFGKTDTTKKLRQKKDISIWVIYKTAKKEYAKNEKKNIEKIENNCLFMSLLLIVTEL